jgi:glycolate oxidase iron-sulfur subunit
MLFPQVNAATARVLAAEGCEVVVPAAQPCCGACSVMPLQALSASVMCSWFTSQLYRGFAKVQLQNLFIASAGNIKRWSRIAAAALSGTKRALLTADI